MSRACSAARSCDGERAYTNLPIRWESFRVCILTSRRPVASRPMVPAPQLDSFNPATGGRIGSVPVTPPGAVEAVVQAVAKVQPFWAQLTLRDRGRYLERAAQVVIDESDAIRDLIVSEQGKPRNEAFS